MKEIKEKLKILKEIKPDNMFVLKTRILLLNQAEIKKFSDFFKFDFNFKFAISLLFIFLLILISGFVLKFKNEKVDNLVYNQLIMEFNNLNINEYIELTRKNEYINESIKLVLNSIYNPKILIENKINKEFEEISKIEINNNFKESEEINNLLDKIIY